MAGHPHAENGNFLFFCLCLVVMNIENAVGIFTWGVLLASLSFCGLCNIVHALWCIDHGYSYKNTVLSVHLKAVFFSVLQGVKTPDKAISNP